MVLSDHFNLNYDLPDHWPNLGLYKVVLHSLQIIFAFLILFLVTPIISASRHYYGSSQASPNFILTLTLASALVALFLALCPWSRFHQSTRIWKFFLRPRTSLVFTLFFSIAWFIGSISITVHATNVSNCTIDSNLVKEDSHYSAIWASKCRCAKAAAVFSWFTFFLWGITLVASIILFWHEKKLKYEKFPAHSEKASCSIYSEKDFVPLPMGSPAVSPFMSPPLDSYTPSPLTSTYNPAILNNLSSPQPAPVINSSHTPFY